MSGKRYTLVHPFGALLGLLPIVFMFVWSWKVGLGWLLLFFVSVREDNS